MELINVNLYGGKSIFGGKETKLEASIIYCDRHQECSYFQNDQCLRVRSAFSEGCRFGKTETAIGYTSRSRNYFAFKSKWNNHEQYSKLSYPKKKMGIIRDKVVLPYPYLTIKENERGELYLERHPFGSSNGNVLPMEQFDVKFIHEICQHRPQALMGGEITSYQKEVVPLFLSHLEELLPELYDSLVKAYPEYAGALDYVGRKAYLQTVMPSMVHYHSRNYPELNEEWQWDGELLTFKAGHLSKVNAVKDYEVELLQIRPTKKATVTITDNQQVSKETVFAD